MKRWKGLRIYLFLAAIFLTICTVLLWNSPSRFAQSIRRARESTLVIVTPKGRGSGVVIGHTLILTAMHVVRDFDRVLVVDRSGDIYEGAKTSWVDHERDLALVRIVDCVLPQIPMRFSNGCELGEKVFSTGYAWQGLEASSSEEYFLQRDGNYYPQCRVGIGHIVDVRENLLYCDIGTFGAGMSGGGIFNTRGELVAVNSSTFVDPIGDFRIGMRIPEGGIDGIP